MVALRRRLRYAVLLSLIYTNVAGAPPLEPLKKNEEYVCVRWTWSGDVYDRRVVCLEWKKQDVPWFRRK